VDPGKAFAHTGHLRLRVERRGGRSAVIEAAGHAPYAPRLLPGVAGWARVVLVQTLGGPLTGDRVEIDVTLESGAALEITATAATLALPMDVPARVEVRVRLGAGSRLAWLPEPLVLAEGADVRSSTLIELAPGAAALWRERIELGRHGESPGNLTASLRAELDGVPLLHEAFETRGGASPAILDGARSFGSLALLGLEPPTAELPGVLALAGPGAVARALGPDAASPRSRLAPVEAAWLATLGSFPR
jgi:urease accessory protein